MQLYSIVESDLAGKWLVIKCQKPNNQFIWSRNSTMDQIEYHKLIWLSAKKTGKVKYRNVS